MMIWMVILTVQFAAVQIPPDVELIRDIVYGTGGGRPLKVDILRPKSLPENPMPVIVWVHGGGWRGGNKEGGIGRLIPFARNGYFCATIEYRLSGEATFPAQIEDCKCAIRFLRAKAQEYHIDPNRIGVWGSSAGGHLVTLLGTTGGIKELEGEGGWQNFSSNVQAVCDWFGPTDFLRMNDLPSRIDHDAPDSPESLLIGGPIQENKEKVERANPITYVTPDDPPFLIMHGDQDLLVPFNQSELLYDALRKAGVEVTLVKVKGAGHGFGGRKVIALVKAFFDKHLKGDDSMWRKLVRGSGKAVKMEIVPEGQAKPRLEKSEKPRGLKTLPFSGKRMSYIYKRTPQGDLKIHLYLPEDWKPTDRRPAILFFFGGGWRGGNVKQFDPQARYFASRGMIAACADYRVKSRHGTTPDKCVEDAKSAIKWLRANASKLGIDPDRIAASGGSAGGHMAIAAFTTKGLEAEGEDLSISSKPNLLVLYNPVLNTLSVVDMVGSEEMAKRISPNHNLTKGVPPAILFFGSKDKFLAGAKEFMKLSGKLGNTAKLYVAEGVGHGFFNRYPWLERTTYLADEFLSSYGYIKGKPTVELPEGELGMKLVEENP